MSETPNKRISSTAGIVTAVIGGILLLVAIAAIVVNSLVMAGRAGNDDPQLLVLGDIQGISAVHAEIGAATFLVEFADVDEVTLNADEGAEHTWVLERRGDVIVVDTDRGFFGGFCLFGCGWSTDRATLTLPKSLEGAIDADLTLGSGSIDANGDFRVLDLDVSAGDLTVRGTAEVLDTQVSAGRANIELDSVREASFEVSAGRIDVDLTGDAPERVSVEVAAGAARLTVPETAYRVESDVAAGSFEHQLRTDPSSRHVISVEVAAGEARINTR